MMVASVRPCSTTDATVATEAAMLPRPRWVGVCQVNCDPNMALHLGSDVGVAGAYQIQIPMQRAEVPLYAAAHFHGGQRETLAIP